MQTKKQSLLEASTNIAIGYSINFTANLIILPMMGFDTLTIKKNLIMGVLYTGIALTRNYCVRRWFNKEERRR